jgi:hypothetical protein
MADHNADAAEAIKLGEEEARLMRKLLQVQAKRCKLLQKHGAALGISPELAARGAEPKRR